MSRSIGWKTAVFFLAVIMTAYLGYQLYSVIKEPVKTVSAVAITVSDSIPLEGIFIRSEIVIPKSPEGTAEFTVSDGERVGKGAEIAAYMADGDAAEKNRRAMELRAQIEGLSKVRARISDTTESSKLDSFIASQQIDILSRHDRGLITDLTSPISDLKALVIRKNYGIGGARSFSEYIKSLEKERQELLDSIKGRRSAVAAPAAGYFSQTVDGYEGTITPEMADTLTAEGLLQILSLDVPPPDALGKLVDNYEWYFAAVIPKNQAAALSKSAVYTLRLEEDVSYGVSVTAYRIDSSKKEALVVFKGGSVSAKLLSMRLKKTELVIKTYSGLKVPKEARRIVDGKLGVYCLDGSRVRFKEISPIYETDSYYVVRADGTKTADLLLHDDIIVKGKALEDRMIIPQ